MSTVFDRQIHYSPKLGRWTACVAEVECPYGATHTRPLELALDGGAEVALRGSKEVQIISAFEEDAFSIGSERRSQTFRRDGTKLTPTQARAWRQAKRQQALLRSQVSPAPIQTGAQPAAATKLKHTSPHDFRLAETSRSAAMLAKLATHDDPAVRLVVSRNPATSTETIESLALSKDKGSSLYHAEAMDALSGRFQDMKDAIELERDVKMRKDAQLQAELSTMPATRILHGMPHRYWERKKTQARRYLVELVLGEVMKRLGLKAQFDGWMRASRTITKVHRLRSAGIMHIQLANSVLQRSSPQEIGRVVTHAAAHIGSGQTTGHSVQWRALFRRFTHRFGFH